MNWLKVYISFSRKDVGGIAYGNGQFVAVGNLGTILTSTDGTNWVQQQSGTTIGLWGVAYGNDQFVAVGSSGTNGTVVTSTDGVSWVQRQLETRGHLYAITYGNGQLVAVGNNLEDGSGTVVTSTDGMNCRASVGDEHRHSVDHPESRHRAVDNFPGRSDRAWIHGSDVHRSGLLANFD